MKSITNRKHENTVFLKRSKTCDEDNKTQFITNVEVTPATTADSTALPNIHDRLEDGQMKPVE